jgi:hypothetical protein
LLDVLGKKGFWKHGVLGLGESEEGGFHMTIEMCVEMVMILK